MLVSGSNKYLPLVDKEIEAQRKKLACPWSEGQERRTQISIFSLMLLDQG